MKKICIKKTYRYSENTHLITINMELFFILQKYYVNIMFADNTGTSLVQSIKSFKLDKLKVLKQKIGCRYVNRIFGKIDKHFVIFTSIF